MRVIIQPSAITGTITAPASKSAMQRACALALLHEGQTIISNPGKSNDDLAAIALIQKLGTRIERKGAELIINSNGIHPIDDTINCGESGLGIRMFAPIAALSAQQITISGEGSLMNRPMDFFDEVFPQLGVSIQTNNGKLPIRLQGPLQPQNITIDGSLSSQFLTGLLVAFAKGATVPVTISVSDLRSKPYIDLTLSMMRHFGYVVENERYERFTIKPQATNSNTQTYAVEGDWSAAAFLLVAGAIAGGITIKGLDLSSMQADRAVLQALMMAGVNLSITENAITVNAPNGADSDRNRYKAFHFIATDCPDLFPPLVALAAYCGGTSVVEGVSRLAHKESNRGMTLQEEFKKMGVEIVLQGDLMMITGNDALKGTTVHSHHDHRIAMACAVAALKAGGETIIEDAEAINKSYPGFYEDLKTIGANIG